MTPTLQAIVRECWKFFDFTDDYQVSMCGKIRDATTGCFVKAAKDQLGYEYVSICSKRYSVHRLVAQAFVANPSDKPCVDHIDRNPSNNDASNLRWCTHQENMRNKTKQKNSTNKFKGIHRHGDRWRAQIYDGENHRRIHLGLFDTDVEAAKAYDRAAIILFGKFACLNFNRDDYNIYSSNESDDTNEFSS